MARQTIALDWKIIETLREGDKFVTKTGKLGKFTQATAAVKMSRRFSRYRFVAKPFSGFGGYWVSPTGDTAECLPA